MPATPKLPTTGQILSEITDAFGLRELEPFRRSQEACGHTVRRYFRGKAVVRACCVQSAVVGSIFHLADRVFTGRLPPGGLHLIGQLVATHFTAWDRCLRRRAKAADEVAVLRLGAIDFAVRASIVIAALRLPPLVEALPTWARLDEEDALLTELCTRSDPPPNKNELAKALGVHRNTVGNWFRGARQPGTEDVTLLAEEFASRIDGEGEQALAARLRIHFGLKRLASVVRAHVGGHVFEEAVLSSLRWANHRAESLRGRVDSGLDTFTLYAVCVAPWLVDYAQQLEHCCQGTHLGGDFVADVRRAQALFLVEGTTPSPDALHAALHQHVMNARPHDVMRSGA
jgi:transcriptional regulator with XRE-family HTH domain